MYVQYNTHIAYGYAYTNIYLIGIDIPNISYDNVSRLCYGLMDGIKRKCNIRVYINICNMSVISRVLWL